MVDNKVKAITSVIIGCAMFALGIYIRGNIASMFLIIFGAVLLAWTLIKAVSSEIVQPEELEDHVERKSIDIGSPMDPIQTDIHERALANISMGPMDGHQQ